MKVILTTDIDRLGKKGDIVQVADGYGRNYLLPRSMAVMATRGSLRQAESMKAAGIEAARRAREQAQALATALAGSPVVVAARSGDEGKLFGSISTADITEAIRKFSGQDIDKSIVSVAQPIREIGRHEVFVKPHPEVEFSLTLEVIPA